MLWFHLRGLLWAIVAGVAAGVVSALAPGRVDANWVAAAVVLVFAVGLAAGVINRRRITYTLTSRRLTVEIGLLGREVRETRLEQIRNVRASQSLWGRVAGVGTVAFDTVGGPVISFAGVRDPRRLARTIDQALADVGGG